MKVVSFVHTADMFDRDRMPVNETNEQTLRRLITGMNFYEKRELYAYRMKLVRMNNTRAFFESRVAPRQEGYINPDETKNWYRTMSREHFEYLMKYDAMPVLTAYGGIAPFYDYVTNTRYTGNNTVGTHTVEFNMDIYGREFKEIIDNRQRNLVGTRNYRREGYKIEAGCLSLGLGNTGTYNGTARDEFNERLRDGRISFRLVRFSCDL